MGLGGVPLLNREHLSLTTWQGGLGSPSCTQGGSPVLAMTTVAPEPHAPPRWNLDKVAGLEEGQAFLSLSAFCIKSVSKFCHMPFYTNTLL
jgi:hypothetical protein